jgi:hypothetical protein
MVNPLFGHPSHFHGCALFPARAGGDVLSLT